VNGGAATTWNQTAAILQAYWRGSWNRLPRITKGNIAMAVLLGVLWYGMFVALAFGAYAVAADRTSVQILPFIFSGGLFMAMAFWQIAPLISASTGSSLQLRQLVVYPVPTNALFTIEAMLRVSTGVEILIVLAGASAGCLRNPLLPIWSPLGFLLFIVFNVLLAAGIREALNRLFARKYVREAVVLLFVLAAILPQSMVLLSRNAHLRHIANSVPLWYLPWTACARIAAGAHEPRAWMVIALWTAAAWTFGRWQFSKSVREVELERPQLESAGAGRRLAWLFQWPSAVFRDPLGGLVEKEIRMLARAPRFRLAFIMGFSFGIIIWVPLSMQRDAGSWIRANFLTVVMAYAVLLLADVLYWNIFGIDRTAAQSYFIYPIPLRSVILAKNVATVFYTVLDVAIVMVVCLLVRLKLTPLQFSESLGACALICVFLVALGNLVSAYNPRAADLNQAFRRVGGVKMQWIGMAAFMCAGIPISMAYLARYAFDTEWAFFGVIVFMLGVGGYLYTLSVDTAQRVVSERKEQALEALSRGSSPIA